MDVIEMLYLARNLAVHGGFEHTVGQHNAIARTALQVLDNLVKKLNCKSSKTTKTMNLMIAMRKCPGLFSLIFANVLLSKNLIT